ncbi:50S ribosomal protein L21 [Blastopirellula marina]|uniref:Large ribosomal subunit protein bL21 n=1 Tax=Blastopirellula marina TaxID=124 RepID=A0A2S8GB35_9BACT|nr:50S ribosomal protein L21 [Blastopirellula marina]PQO41314.1 50S ribosomal protein L21 [Blastopirellula marina]
MYAIIKEDGKQIKVEEGQELRLDYRADASAGDQLTFGSVLCVSGEEGVKLGKPVLDGASVTAEVVGVVQGPKLVIQKFRRRKNSRRKTGHRQLYTKVKIGKITV